MKATEKVTDGMGRPDILFLPSFQGTTNLQGEKNRSPTLRNLAELGLDKISW